MTLPAIPQMQMLQGPHDSVHALCSVGIEAALWRHRQQVTVASKCCQILEGCLEAQLVWQLVQNDGGSHHIR